MSLNFQNIKGDTFEQVPFEVKINNVAVNLTGAIVKMQLRKECGGVIGLTLTSVASAGITITDAVNGKFKINKQIIDIPSYNYYYDIEIKFADGTVKTWIDGMFNIICDITR
jgi:hypothetical protein